MKAETDADFDGIIRSAKLLAVASAWSELGLWDELARHRTPLDLGELPGDTRALTISAAVLAHAGLLDGGGRKWQMSALARDLHERAMMPTPRNLDWLADLARMSDVLRSGGPVRDSSGQPKATSGGVHPEDPEAARRFLDMLHRRSAGTAETVADWLTTRLRPHGHVLDVGGGHGRYASALVDRGYHATVFDLPVVIDIVRERHGDRLSYIKGDFHTDAFGSGYEGALMSNIVHGESSDTNADIVRRIHQALEPGGWLVLKDMFIDEQGRDPESAVFFGVTMLYYTWHGQSYTLQDVTRWCRAAGYEPPEIVSVAGQTLVFARKPQAA